MVSGNTQPPTITPTLLELQLSYRTMKKAQKCYNQLLVLASTEILKDFGPWVKEELLREEEGGG